MQLYLDTADRHAAEPLLATGLFTGITTNPTIIDRAGLTVADIADIHGWAVAAGARETYFQVWGRDESELVDRGLRLRELGDDVVVKLPADRAGTAALATLSAARVPTLLTAVYAPIQAVLAAAAGADYLAPYVGKLDEAGHDGIATVVHMQEILASTHSSTKVVVASIRSVDVITALARYGVECFTMSVPVAHQLFDNELTAAAVATFDDVVAAGQRT